MFRFFKPQSGNPGEGQGRPGIHEFSRSAWHAPFLDTGSHRHDGKAEAGH